jgi:hypothetical protein
MKQFLRDGAEVWVGVHKTKGILLYDPGAQVDVATGRVRLYVYPEQRMATFSSVVVRKGFIRGDAETEAVSFNEAVDFYLNLRCRFTLCHGCQRDLNSIDFDLCGVCRWIKCKCGACGCNYHGPHR